MRAVLLPELGRHVLVELEFAVTHCIGLCGLGNLFLVDPLALRYVFNTLANTLTIIKREFLTRSGLRFTYLFNGAGIIVRADGLDKLFFDFVFV